MSYMAYAIHKIRTSAVPISVSRNSRNVWSWGDYEGDELKPFEGRPGAMDAFTLPSRRDDCLHWPDGSVTDIHNRPVVLVEPVVTLPSFPKLVKGMNHAVST